MTTDTSTGRIAVVGGGVAGLTAAWLLNRRFSVDLYERNDYLGGHTCTATIDRGPDAGTVVDMGFIVMNNRNYPLFSKLLEQLQIKRAPSDMSFGYHCRDTGYSYCGTGFSGLFADRRNLLKSDHWRLLADIRRFNRDATAIAEADSQTGVTLDDVIKGGHYSDGFANHYLLAMGSAIWSSPPDEIRNFPAQAFINFFHHHGLLSLQNRPQWQFVRGGSHTYVKAMRATLSGAIHLSTPAVAIQRNDTGAIITRQDGTRSHYDAVVVATHANEALALLRDPSPDEKRLLGPWRYAPNEVVLHDDPSVMPPNRRAWASWNFARRSRHAGTGPATISYHMNRLQQLRTERPYFVSLNDSDAVRSERRHRSVTFSHPVYTAASMRTQADLPGLNRQRNTYFCGSYFGYGFHEDAVRSAVQVANAFGVTL
ncbi:MAG: FAD-dependent oxidoreductase [Verrucomicrobia bacterium]|nr:FAD-dependent oxidoreductase [Verrucomicrobiota bacterium]